MNLQDAEIMKCLDEKNITDETMKFKYKKIRTPVEIDDFDNLFK